MGVMTTDSPTPPVQPPAAPAASAEQPPADRSWLRTELIKESSKWPSSSNPADRLEK